MKRILLFVIILLNFSDMISAQDISLPKAEQNRRTLSVSETLATRHSVREFSSADLTLQDISDLCWAACGMSRDDSHRTAPTAMNRQEIRLFVFMKKGTYEYIALDNMLRLLAPGDNRRLIAGGSGFSQDFVLDAPVSLVEVIDFGIFGSRDQHAMMMTCVDAGNVSENINLFCQASGMVTVPRATMDVKGIVRLLNLSEECLPIMNNPVGYPKDSSMHR